MRGRVLLLVPTHSSFSWINWAKFHNRNSWTSSFLNLLQISTLTLSLRNNCWIIINNTPLILNLRKRLEWARLRSLQRKWFRNRDSYLIGIGWRGVRMNILQKVPKMTNPIPKTKKLITFPIFQAMSKHYWSRSWTSKT